MKNIALKAESNVSVGIYHGFDQSGFSVQLTYTHEVASKGKSS